jgi:arginyl-tRNA synthetase
MRGLATHKSGTRMTHLEHLQQYLGEVLIRQFGPEAGTVEVGFDLPPEPGMGHLSLSAFAMAKHLRTAPARIVSVLTPELAAHPLVKSATPAGPYLNLELHPAPWFAQVITDQLAGDPGVFHLPEGERHHVVIEYSSPNTNKPQHLGHVRNNVLGNSLARLLAAVGHRVTRVNLVNDRGVHICQSMLAWQLWGQGETPESTGLKGDHLVGRFYVIYAGKLAQEKAEWCQRQGLDPTDEAVQERFEQESPLMEQTRAMLLAWEAGDPEVRDLWKRMNGWVLEGFRQTYDRLGIGFDRVYYESDLWELGREIVFEGLERGIFRRAENGAVLADLPGISPEPKALTRGDGTTIYITQDLGTAVARQQELGFDEMIYVVANEQEHHFKVLFGTCCSSWATNGPGACSTCPTAWSICPAGA